MAAPVTLADVAREAGVSLATASRAINGSSTRVVRDDLRARVRAAAQQLHYTPNANAQAMARGATTLLGLVVHDIADPYFASIAAGVAEAAGAAGLQMTLVSTQRDPAQEVRLVDLLKRQRARAVILAGGRTDDGHGFADLRHAIALYRAVGGAVAVIGEPVLGVDCVVAENGKGAAELARALVGLGYTDFAVLGGPEHHLTARTRREAFLDELAAHGIAVPPHRRIESAFSREGGEQAMRALLDSGERPQLVFAANDLVALGALAAARDHGLRVPDDVAVAGFADIPTLRDVVPGLTTVHIPLVEMGVAATRLALSEPSDEPRLLRVAADVVLRDSTPARR